MPTVVSPTNSDAPTKDVSSKPGDVTVMMIAVTNLMKQIVLQILQDPNVAMISLLAIPEINVFQKVTTAIHIRIVLISLTKLVAVSIQKISKYFLRYIIKLYFPICQDCVMLIPFMLNLK